MDSLKPKNILVTGAAGFIGSNFVRRFQADYPDCVVVALDDLSTGHREALPDQIVFYEGSILDTALLDKIFSRHSLDYVFHFAAMPMVAYSVAKPADTTQTNLVGTINLLTRARDYQIKRFIYSSSAAVYGRVAKLPISEDEVWPDPQSPYAIQKYAGEQFCRLFSRLWQLDTVSLRYFNAYGPGQDGHSAYATVIASWLESLFFPGSQPPYLEGDGQQTRDFCFVEDIVLANLLAMKANSKLGGEVCNIASGVGVKLLTIKESLEKLTGRSLNLELRPERLGDIKHSLADIAKAKRVLGYEPQIDLGAGLKATINWQSQRR